MPSLPPNTIHPCLHSRGASFPVHSLIRSISGYHPNQQQREIGKGRQVVDENIHIDKPTRNQVLLTGCSISGRRRCDELGEPVGNFKGGVLYAWQSVRLSMEVLQKHKDESLSAALLSGLRPVLIAKTEFVISGHVHESDHEMIEFMCRLVSAKSANIGLEMGPEECCQTE